MCSRPLPGEAVEEAWRVVPGYPTLKVSSIGRVIGPRGTILRAHICSGNGYYMVAAKSKTSVRKQDQVYVHRLVADAFLGPCPEKHEVNHINCHRDDNRVTNLEYVTHLGNAQHSQRLGRMRTWKRLSCEEHHSALLTNAQVLEIRSLAAAHSPQELADKFGVSRGNINQLLRGDTYQDVTGGVPVIAGKKDERRDWGEILSAALTIDGVTFTVSEWATKSGIRDDTLRYRLLTGMSPHDAVTTPVGKKRPKPQPE